MQMKQRFFSTAIAMSAAAVLSACGATGYPYQAQQPYYSSTATHQDGREFVGMGRVTNVQLLRRGRSSDAVAGTVIGGAVGGLAGNQVGKGKGRTAATIAGAIGGALIGRSIQRNQDSGDGDIYRVTVQLDNGAVRSFDYAQRPNVQIGDRVRADGDQLYR